jgi:hypothetical protein
MDWYTDKDGTNQYNPDLTKKNQSDILKKGQTYLGATYQVKDKKGNVTEDYRDDGSIMYSKESSGYSRIWNNSQKTKKEEMGVITDKSVLVLPSYKNKSITDLSDYGYSSKNGNIVDSKGTEYNTAATVHTHPGGGPPSTYELSDWGDLGFATYITPYKPVYVLQMKDRNVISFIVSASPSGKMSDARFRTYNITYNYPAVANPSNLINGHFSLYQYTKSNNFRKILDVK